MKLNKYNLMKKLQAEVDAVTEEEIAEAATHLPPIEDKAKKVGAIESDDLKRLYYARHNLAMRSNAHQMVAMSTSGKARLTAMREAAWSSMLHKIAEALFWSQTRAEVNYWGQGCGLRADWTVVEYLEEEEEESTDSVSESIMESIREKLGPGFDIKMKSIQLGGAMSGFPDFLRAVLEDIQKSRTRPEVPDPVVDERWSPDKLEALYGEDDKGDSD